MESSGTLLRKAVLSAKQAFILQLSVSVIGFSLVFLRPIVHHSSNTSVLSAPNWIDKYWNFMTHPAVVAIYLLYVWILLRKEQKFWLRLLLVGLAGSFSGQLCRQLLLRFTGST
jgi:hypothetical protein